MSQTTQGKIAFEVETARVLEILSKEIYDSPMALLRENVQNAYDATLMRLHGRGFGSPGGNDRPPGRATSADDFRPGHRDD